MPTVYLGIGSNIEPEKNLRAGLAQLRDTLGGIDCSPVYRSTAVGFDGDDFLNLVARCEINLSVAQLSAYLRELEQAFGRPENAKKFSPRKLDVDILLYGQLAGSIDGVELPRREILENAFVLKPLCDLAPELCHPASGKSYRELWQDFKMARQPPDNIGQDIWLTDIQP